MRGEGIPASLGGQVPEVLRRRLLTQQHPEGHSKSHGDARSPKHRATRWGGPRGGPSPSACSSTVLIPVSLGLCLVHELGLRSSRCPPVILERRPGSLPVPQFPPDLAQRQPTAACPRPRCPHVSSGGPSPQQQPAKHREARGKEENSQSKKKKNHQQNTTLHPQSTWDKAVALAGRHRAI